MATMKTRPKAAAVADLPAKTYEGLAPEQLIQIYRLMYQSRCIDDREILLKRQQRVFFQISAAGHEALLVAAGMVLKPGYDWFYPYSGPHPLPGFGHDIRRDVDERRRCRR